MADQLNKTISGINLKTTTSLINTAGFIAYSLDEFNFSKNADLKKNEKDALTYSSILLAIAGGHYAVIDSNRPDTKSEIIIRYSDWLFTTPLLLKVMTSYYELSDNVSYELIAYNLIMIISGLIYELTGNIKFWVLGTVAYIVLAIRLYAELSEYDLFFRYFVVGWSLYGVISLLPREQRLILYNFLDLYNKLIFAMEIRTRIGKDLDAREEYYSDSDCDSSCESDCDDV